METNPYKDQDFEIELDESPSRPRPDNAPVSFICDENGDLEPKPLKLEKRGTTSHAELWSKGTIHKLSIASKLAALGRSDLSKPLLECHTVETAQVCVGCRRVSIFMNRCERHYCPECAPRLARERRESVEWWTKTIAQPKHVVLTCRNTVALTKAHVLWFKQCFSRLRRRKFAKNWKGGFYRLEMTNESKGWHLHLHALVDAHWIDKQKLVSEWASVLGQAFAIVDVSDCYDKSYLAEVTKYTVKGSQLAGWTGEQIAEFLDAFDGVKTFGVFGSLYGKRTEWREWIDSLQGKAALCECGCSNFRIMSPCELQWERLQNETRVGRAGVPPPVQQPDLLNLPLVEGMSPTNAQFR